MCEVGLGGRAFSPRGSRAPLPHRALRKQGLADVGSNPSHMVLQGELGPHGEADPTPGGA